MSHSQKNPKNPIALKVPKSKGRLAYQNFAEEAFRPPRPEERKNEEEEEVPSDQNQEHDRSISSEIEYESPTQSELKEAINRFVDKYCTNQFYILLVLLPFFVDPTVKDYDKIREFYFLGIGVIYFIDLIVACRRAQAPRESARAIYKMFEFAGIIAFIFLPSNLQEMVSLYVFAIFLPMSYVIKVVTAYNHNQSARVSFVNNMNNTILIIRVLIIIQWLIGLVQVNFNNPLSPHMALLPFLGIMLIVLLFTIRLISQMFIAYRSQIWNSNPSQKTKGALWIFGNLFTLLIVLLALAYDKFYNSSLERPNFGLCLTLVIWCVISLIFSICAREGVLEIFCELVNILEPSEYINENDLPEFVVKITNTLFRPATEEEVNEFARDQYFSDEMTGEGDTERGNTQETVKCLKCDRKTAKAMFMACGHGGLCFSCAKKRNKGRKECHLCSKKIKAVLEMDIRNSQGKFYKIVGNVINREEESS